MMKRRESEHTRKSIMHGLLEFLKLGYKFASELPSSHSKKRDLINTTCDLYVYILYSQII